MLLCCSCVTLSHQAQEIQTINQAQSKSCQLLGKVVGESADRNDARIKALNEAGLLKASHIVWVKEKNIAVGLGYVFTANAYRCK